MTHPDKMSDKSKSFYFKMFSSIKNWKVNISADKINVMWVFVVSPPQVQHCGLVAFPQLVLALTTLCSMRSMVQMVNWQLFALHWWTWLDAKLKLASKYTEVHSIDIQHPITGWMREEENICNCEYLNKNVRSKNYSNVIK